MLIPTLLCRLLLKRPCQPLQWPCFTNELSACSSLHHLFQPAGLQVFAFRLLHDPDDTPAEPARPSIPSLIHSGCSEAFACSAFFLPLRSSRSFSNRSSCSGSTCSGAIGDTRVPAAVDAPPRRMADHQRSASMRRGYVCLCLGSICPSLPPFCDACAIALSNLLERPFGKLPLNDHSQPFINSKRLRRAPLFFFLSFLLLGSGF